VNLSFLFHSFHRWKHTAVGLDENRILIFGGLADKNKRFDDAWIFDVALGLPWPNHYAF
jgi:hypothetical protein